jgi:hypothetical protein
MLCLPAVAAEDGQRNGDPHISRTTSHAAMQGTVVRGANAGLCIFVRTVLQLEIFSLAHVCFNDWLYN